MRTDLFDFELPPAHIAQEPARPRETAKLLHVTNELADRQIADLPNLLKSGDLLILNNTRVLPTRFAAKRDQITIDITLVESEGESDWWAFAKPGRKVRVDDRLVLANGLEAVAQEKAQDGRIRLRFDLAGQALIERIKATGSMPLPPYIKRPKGHNQRDSEHYQTVFAAHDGSVAAPTASLHLSEAMLETLQTKGIEHQFVTLHVGMGTFLPVKSETTDGHVMHKEWYDIPSITAARINEVKKAGGRIIAVGTTVIRTLESAAIDGAPNGILEARSGDTKLFIQPGFEFRIVDNLLTNFHLPRSTLFMLVCAFAGLERMQDAYRHAISQDYRFFSYGDACLLEAA